MLEFLGSLILNLMLDFGNSKWRTRYGGPKKNKNVRIWITLVILEFLRSLIPNLTLDFQNSK